MLSSDEDIEREALENETLTRKDTLLLTRMSYFVSCYGLVAIVILFILLFGIFYSLVNKKII